MKQCWAVVAGDGREWQEVDPGTDLVLCTPAQMTEAKLTGRPPEGIRFSLARILAGLDPVPGE